MDSSEQGEGCRWQTIKLTFTDKDTSGKEKDRDTEREEGEDREREREGAGGYSECWNRPSGEECESECSCGMLLLCRIAESYLWNELCNPKRLYLPRFRSPSPSLVLSLFCSLSLVSVVC